MSTRTVATVIAVVIAIGLVAWGVAKGIERLAGPDSVAAPATETAGAAQVAHISATLFFGAAEDDSLVAVRHEVPLGSTVVEQATEILNAELQPAAPPLVQVIPAGTRLRGFYVTERGDAFVDLSAEAGAKHAGGSTVELLTVYAIVNAVTTNLPTVKRVQLLVDGKEVDTLAGHVDLRRPLIPNTSFVRDSPHTPASHLD